MFLFALEMNMKESFVGFFQLDCGVPEKLCLMSRDEQSVLVVSYAELKHCFMTAFSELIQSSQSSQQAAFS